MNKPQVSVIVPVYNMGERLTKTINSLLHQTLKTLEIIIINDASTDNSGDIIKLLAEKHKNIVTVNFSENKGVHEARLAGLKISSAPWIGFLDADDFARPKMFSTLLSAAEENNVDIVVCGSDRVTEKRKVIASKIKFRKSKKIENDIFKKFCAFEFGTGMLWNKLYNRKVIEPYFNLKFPWRQSINEDLILNIGCYYQAKSIYLLSDSLHEYVYNRKSITSQINKVKAYVELYKSLSLAVSIFNKNDDYILYEIIKMYQKQFSWSCYHVNNKALLKQYDAELKKASILILKNYPIALPILTASKTEIKELITRLIKKIFRY
ncbi:glycosyltransferase [Amphritea sp. 2_MG-2023]|uniref:glycosyltransferase family 2 protein n=1 Tax=Amphritea TaxID=515417 RepID=UPI001C0741A4|nr:MULTISPECIES: glycosyltransferase [Amphritea]MBU2964973.1 glycosyltransferase [Amphritea atlantica]MDO6419648.1 glycosyltransferase [Amphritea sp. 2_MG-2023]